MRTPLMTHKNDRHVRFTVATPKVRWLSDASTHVDAFYNTVTMHSGLLHGCNCYMVYLQEMNLQMTT